MKFKFSRKISEKAQMSDLIKIRPVGAVFFHTDGRTEGHDEANSRFSQFDERAWSRWMLWRQIMIILRIRTHTGLCVKNAQCWC